MTVAVVVVVALLLGFAIAYRPSYKYYRQAIAQCIEWGNSFRIEEDHFDAELKSDADLINRARASFPKYKDDLPENTISDAERTLNEMDSEGLIGTPSPHKKAQINCSTDRLPVQLRQEGGNFKVLTSYAQGAISKLDDEFKPLRMVLFDADPDETAQMRTQVAAIVTGVNGLYDESKGLVDDEGLRENLSAEISRVKGDVADTKVLYSQYCKDQDALYKAADAVVASRNKKEGIDCGHQRCVALTFDDGPKPETTPKLSAQLRSHGTHATFFVMGENAMPDKDSIANSAHRLDTPIGSHTWSHEDLPKVMKQHDEIQQLDAAKKAILDATGHVPNEVRPPHGTVDEASRVYIGQHLGSSVVVYGADSFDWAKGATVSSVKAKVEAEVQPGSIILMHDVYQHTVDAAPRILRDLGSEGYRFVTIPELTGEYPRAGVIYYGRDDILRI